LIGGLLAIRFRGVDPDRWLSRCLPFVGWLFGMGAVVFAAVMMAAAVVLVLTEWQRVAAELPSFRALSSPDGFVPWLAVIAGVKLLHELGHAFACKRFGGECRELGVMLLAFTPCLYCNVSDAWLLKSRRHRMAVGAAGIYVELILASVSTFLWHFSAPGTFHSLCLTVMAVCSVNTVLLNGNPLLRYDGYHILADLIDVPNLRGRADQLVRALFWRIGCGVETTTPFATTAWSRGLLTAYGVAAGLYSWVVLFAILWMLYRVAEAWHVEAMIVALGGLMIAGRVTGALAGIARGLRAAARNGSLRPSRLGLTAIACAAFIWGAANLEIERRTHAPLLIRPADAIPVFVTVAGRPREGGEVRLGDGVLDGATLLRLENPELEGELLKLEGEVARLSRRLDLLESRRGIDPNAAQRIPAERAALADFTGRLDERRRESKRLTVAAPRAGLVVSPEMPQRKRETPLAGEGGPLHPRNATGWLDVGTPVCLVADPVRREAVAYVDQADTAEIRIGAAVKLTTPQTAGRRLGGVVTRIAPGPTIKLPAELLASGAIEVSFGIDGNPVPIDPVHEVRVVIDDEAAVPLVLNQQGTARISLGRETLVDRMHRFLRRTFGRRG